MALKILARDASRHELNVMKQIGTSRNDPNAARVVHLLDHFEQPGNAGTHLCLVLELMWQNAVEFCKGLDDNSRLRVVRRISTQTLQGVEFLHKCGIVHNGNLPHLYSHW